MLLIRLGNRIMRRVVLLPCKVSHQFLSSAFDIDEIGLNQTDRLDVR